MICFTQEFYDGKEPPPSSLLDHSFWFPFETPPLVTVGENQAVKFDSLWNEMEAEATPSKERDDIVRALLRLLFYTAARIYRSLYEQGGVQFRKASRAASDGIFVSLWRSIFVRQLRFRIMRNICTLPPITSGR